MSEQKSNKGLIVKKEGVSSSVNQVVFANDEVREIILDYAIRSNKNGSVCRPTIPVFRLVQKSWLRTTTKILQKSREPLFNIKLSKENSVNGAPYVLENGKLLDHFINTVTGDSRLDDSVPPFKLKIREDFFRQENHQSFSDLLVKCGGGLVELEMIVPWKVGSLACVFPIRVNLPLLKKLTVNLTDVKLKKLEKGEAVYPHNNNATNLIHYFLNAAEALTELVLPYDSELTSLPTSFELLFLPTTLTKLVLECKLRSKDLEILIRSQLPKLTSLQLFVPDYPYADGKVFQILNNFRTTLRTLVIFGLVYGGPPRRVTPFHFPVMDKLECFSTTSMNLELEPKEEGALSLENYLPKLTSLELYGHTATMLRKWTTNSKLASVGYLQLMVVNDMVAEKDDCSDYVLSLDTETMESLDLTFPNLQRLELHLSLSEPENSGLKYLFKKMNRLTCLKIVVCGSSSEMNSDIWDALLIGVPVGLIAGMRSIPDYWKFIQIQNGRLPSIRMMEGLTCLSLEANCEPGTAAPALISDLVFKYSFLNMPKLTDLHFQGRFKVSDKMTRVWSRTPTNVLVYRP